MKAVLFPSVVALVAGQPAYFNQLPPKYQPGPCNNPYFRRNHAPGTIASAQCCLTAIPTSPPFPPPGFLPPFETAPCQQMPGAPFGMPPSPAFLDAVCCSEGTTCCDKDTSVRQFKHFLCCDDATHICVHADDGTGSCEENIDGNEIVPNFDNSVDGLGRCPDGGLPVPAPGLSVPLECSSNNEIYPEDGANKCPPESVCVKDKQPNRNTGVCCFNSGCELNTDCQTCVRRDQHQEDYKDKPCSWLTQGDEFHAGGRCVRSCQTFGDKSCILPERAAECPLTSSWLNGTNYNTGTCDRRCGMTGTGRSSRINNGMQNYLTEPSEDATECCKDVDGDYCCAFDLTIAVHCRVGRVPHGPLCGTPLSGTPNNFFNSGPGTIPPSMGALQSTLYRPPPPPFGYPYGGFGYPMGPGFGYPMMGVPMGGMYAPAFYRDYGAVSSDEEAQKNAMAEHDKMYFYAPRPPMPFGIPPPPPPPPAARVDQQPTAFVCSCDSQCVEDKYADCCEDYFDFCTADGLPQWAVDLGWTETN